MQEQRLEFKAEMVRKRMTQRDMARALRERGVDAEPYDIARIVAGRWNPPDRWRREISEILGRPAFELIPMSGRAA